MAEYEARTPVTDVAAVLTGPPGWPVARSDNTVVSRSFAEVVDLIGEGVIEGITSGEYKYEGVEKAVGYDKVNFESYTATGVLGEADTTPAKQQRKDLGFLRSVYWNEVPVVDSDGFYNFASVNLQYVNGNPAGNIPVLSSDMSSYAGLSPDEELDLTINRSIGERLYGPEIKGGGDSPTITKNASLKHGTQIDKYAKTYSILNKEVTKIEVNIKVPALSEILQSGQKKYKKKHGPARVGYGDTKARTIRYSIYYRPLFDKRFSQTSIKDGNQTTPTQAVWKLGVSETITGMIANAYIRRSTIDLSSKHFEDVDNFEGWEIRIVRITPESLTSFLRNSSYVDSIVEVYGTRLRYPYSSMIYSQFDARSFTRLPSRAYDAHLTKVLIPSNYNPVLKKYGDSRLGDAVQDPAGVWTHPRTNTKITIADNIVTQWEEIDTPATPFWDGDFKKENGDYIREWTDNPAWCFYDILTNPRYGVGEFIKETEVDQWTLYEIARFCDILVPDTYGALEPNFTINHIILSREEAFKVLNDLTSVFRGIAYYTNGSIFAVQDKFKDPVYQFNNSNVVNGNFTYSSSSQKARHTVAIVRYNDKRNLFQPTIEYLEDEEAVRRYGIREIETSALGCTSRGQARRFAKWILASEFNETETVSFSVGNDGAYLMPGDVVQIYDNYRSPLKYSGRTNAVRPLILDDNEGQQNVAKPSDWDSDSFNSVILDQALNFNENNLYKFSILTPTYNLSSGDASDIRRNQIQNLLFSGAHTNTITGDYRSDFMESGSGVCTQIYFNTGDFFQKDVTINAGGTGNKLNFNDYVITGYTNTGVNAESPEGPPHSISYSGGYYSGENLIWSIEPNDPDDPEFISGNYSNFKIINIKEEDTTYGISALAYSTGKYDNITAAGVVVTSERDKPPLFPYDPNTASATPIDSEGESALLLAKQGVPYPTDAGYDTVEIRFPQAGYKVIDNNGNWQIQNPLVDKLQEDTEPKKDVYNINYTLGFFKDSEISSAYADYGLPASPDSDKVYVIDSSKFKKYQEFSIDVLPYTDIEHEGQQDSLLDDTMFSEYLITDAPYMIATDYWVSLFATSVTNQVSRGLAIKIEITATSKTSSTIKILELSNLTTEGISVTSDTPVHNILDPSPVFTWITTAKGISNLEGQAPITVDGQLQSYDADGIPKFDIEFNQDVVEYRLTARSTERPEKDGESINSPGSYIYFEATGYAPQNTTPSFLVNSEILNPNTIEDLRTDAHVTGWKDGVEVEGWEDKSAEYKGDPKNADWLSVSGSGINIRNKTEDFPLREFDFVVEMHDGEGNTSAGNKIYDNTIKGETDKETFDKYDFAANSPPTYDILGVKIPAPSGILFCQREEANNEFIDGVTAATNSLPYLATAAIYPDGNLKVRIIQAEGLNAEPTLSQDQLDSFFSNAAGVVYYFTTGDNTLITSSNGTTRLNMAPQFDLHFTQTTTSSDDNKKAFQTMTDTTEGKAFGGIMTLNEDYRGNVFRRIFPFPEDQDPLDLIMPIPYLGTSQVANIQISMGMYDDLHEQIYFNEEGKARTYNQGEDETPLLFRSHTLNFSRSINEGIPYTTDDDTAASIINSKGEYKEGYSSSESMPLAEVGLTSTSEKAKAFTAWGQVVCDPRKFGLFEASAARQLSMTTYKDAFATSQQAPVGKTKYELTNKTTGSNPWDWSSTTQTSKNTFDMVIEGNKAWGWDKTFSLMQIFYDYWGIIYKPDWSPGVRAQENITYPAGFRWGVDSSLAYRRAAFAWDWIDPYRDDCGNIGIRAATSGSGAYMQYWQGAASFSGNMVKDPHLTNTYWYRNMWEPRMWEFDFEKDGKSIIDLTQFEDNELRNGKIDMMQTGDWNYVMKMIRCTPPLKYTLPRDSMFVMQENTDILFHMEVWPQPIRKNETESGREDNTIVGWEIAARFSATITSPTGGHRDTVVFPLGTPHSSLDYTSIPADDDFFEVFPRLKEGIPSDDDFPSDEEGVWIRTELRRRLRRMNFDYHFNENGHIILKEHPLSGDSEHILSAKENVNATILMTNTMGRFAGGGRETKFQQMWALNKPVTGTNHFYEGTNPTDKLDYWNWTKSNFGKSANNGLSWGMSIGQAKEKVKGEGGHTAEPRLGFKQDDGVKPRLGTKSTYRLDEWVMSCKSEYVTRGNSDREAWGNMKDRPSFTFGAEAAARENWPLEWMEGDGAGLSDPMFLFDWGIIKTK